MGIVQKQGVNNAIFSYIGVFLGAINKAYLFPTFLTRAEFGLEELLIAFMVLSTEFSQFGLSKIIIRFFPYFQKHPTREGSFLYLVTLYTLIGFALFTTVILLFQPLFIDLYQEKSPLFSSRYLYIIPMVIGFSLQKILMSLSQAVLKSVVPLFAKNVLLRLYHLIMILLYHWEWMTFDQFLAAYVWGYFLPVIITGLYLVWLKKLHFKVAPGVFKSRIVRLIIRYGIFTALTEAAIIMVNRIDIMMLGSMKGEELAGTYGFAYYIAALILVPASSLNAIVIPLVARHLKSRNIPAVLSLYQKTAINNLIVGLLFVIGISLNLDFFFELFPKHSIGKYVAIFLSMGILFNVSTGVNRGIIVNSKFYRFDLWANIVLLFLVILTNYLLIPIYGINGAAIATTGSLILYNSVGTIFVWLKFRIQPFTPQTLKTIGIGIGVFILGRLLPDTGMPLGNIVFHSGVITIVYGLAIFFTKVSPELNQMVINRFK